MSGEVVTVTAEWLGFLRGLKAFEQGSPCPAKPSDDDPCISPSACEWLGWRLGYARQSMKRLRTMELLGIEDQD